MPKRVQRRMTEGWRAPLDPQGRAPLYVGRPGTFGNPNRVVKRKDTGGWHVEHKNGGGIGAFSTEEEAAAVAVDCFRHEVENDPVLLAKVRTELAGRDLMCWCPLDQPCHADVLLEICQEVAL